MEVTTTTVTRPAKCPRAGCGGRLEQDREDEHVVTCLSCSTALDLRPIRREGRFYLEEDKGRAVAMAERIGFLNADRILGLPAGACYQFKNGMEVLGVLDPESPPNGPPAQGEANQAPGLPVGSTPEGVKSPPSEDKAAEGSNAEKKAWIIAAYRSGLKVNDIMRKFETSHAEIYHVLHRAKVQLRRDDPSHPASSMRTRREATQAQGAPGPAAAPAAQDSSTTKQTFQLTVQPGTKVQIELEITVVVKPKIIV